MSHDPEKDCHSAVQFNIQGGGSKSHIELRLLLMDSPTDKSSGLLRLITDGPTDKSSGLLPSIWMVLRINHLDLSLALRTPDC